MGVTQTSVDEDMKATTLLSSW